MRDWPHPLSSPPTRLSVKNKIDLASDYSPDAMANEPDELTAHRSNGATHARRISV